MSLAAQGIAAFVYDKRGTGSSGGEYTQNFELLAADAAAALAQRENDGARSHQQSRLFRRQPGRLGSAARRDALRRADFVAIGFGLVASPIEEDREQMISEARRSASTAQRSH